MGQTDQGRTLPRRESSRLGPDLLVRRHLLARDHLAYPRYVHQVLVIQVLGDRVAAPRAAAERRRRREAVRERAARGQRARLIHDEPAYGQLDARLTDVLLVVRVHRGRMARALDEEVRLGL